MTVTDSSQPESPDQPHTQPNSPTNTTSSVEAAALLTQLTLEEKVSLLAGSAAWLSSSVPRLDIPSIKLSDGPNASRGDAMRGVPAACFPVGSAMAATWNRDLIYRVGTALGQEAQTKDVQVLLGPTINLHRHPLGGRHFECYSEDPMLTGEIACSFIQGVQSQGVGACAKHFVCNDSEFERHTISSKVDARTLRELYLRPFEVAVKRAQVWTVMSAYNRINGVFASSHQELLVDVLKGEWGFDGAVVSDWGAALETVANLRGGLDLEMPGPTTTRGARLVNAVRQGEVSEALVDESVARLLRLIARSGRFDRPARAEQAVDNPDHRALARDCAAQAMVLLKNASHPGSSTKLLPLAADPKLKLAVIGPNAANGQIQGGGSSAVFPHYQVMPLTAIRNTFANTTYAPGCYNHKYVTNVDPQYLRAPDSDSQGIQLTLWASLDTNTEPQRQRLLSGRPSPWGFIPLGRPGKEDTPFANNEEGFSARLETDYRAPHSGAFDLGLLSSGQAKLTLDGEELIDNWTDTEPGDAFFGSGTTEKRATRVLEENRRYRLRIDFQCNSHSMLHGVRFGVMPATSQDSLSDALAAANDADAVVLVVGSNSDWETEGNDRTDINLPGDQNALIQAVAAANPNTVVVLNTGAPMAMPWLDDVAAVIQAWLPGQEFGNALVDVLTGACDATGRLPTTFPVRLQDTPAHPHYPGTNGVVHYDEGLLMGYRGYIESQTKPLFAFGHGLSYSQWELTDLQVQTQGQQAQRSLTARATLRNIGDRAGSQVVQLYVRDATNTVSPAPVMLGAFAKYSLAPGESRQIELRANADALRYWDADHAVPGWRYPPGAYQVQLGFAVDNLPLNAKLQLS